MAHTHGLDTSPDLDIRVRPEPHPREVLATVAALLPGRASITEIKGKLRAPRLVLVRKACALALRRRGCSFPEIGRVLGGRDHTSIMYLVARALELEFAAEDTEARVRFRAAVRAGARLRRSGGCAPCVPACPLCAPSAPVDA